MRSCYTPSRTISICAVVALLLDEKQQMRGAAAPGLHVFQMHGFDALGEIVMVPAYRP